MGAQFLLVAASAPSTALSQQLQEATWRQPPRTGPDPRRWWGLALLCGALGVAIATTVAVATSGRSLAGNQAADPLVVLTEGFQAAFVALVVLAGIGMALALLLLGRPPNAPQERLEAAPVPVHND